MRGRSVRLRRGEASPSDLREALDRLDVEPGDDFWIVTDNPQVSGASIYDLDAHDEDQVGPWHRDGSQTAREAAKFVYPRSGTLRHICLTEIAAAGERGATSDEIAAKYGRNLYSVKPRFIELRENGWIEMNGATRLSDRGCAVDVHVLTERGRRELPSEALF
jgi:hypothetical protein